MNYFIETACKIAILKLNARTLAKALSHASVEDSLKLSYTLRENLKEAKRLNEEYWHFRKILKPEVKAKTLKKLDRMASI